MKSNNLKRCNFYDKFKKKSIRFSLSIFENPGINGQFLVQKITFFCLNALHKNIICQVKKGQI